MDRVLASEAKGRAFESRRARHFHSALLSAATSPTHFTDAVQAAVLLIHDESDTISPLAQSESMAAALRRAGKRVQLTVLRGEDHHLEEPETRIRVLQELETFLATHLPPLPATTDR